MGRTCSSAGLLDVALGVSGKFRALYTSSAAGDARMRAMRSFLFDLLGTETLARVRMSLRSTTLRALLGWNERGPRREEKETHSLASMAGDEEEGRGQ